MKTVNLENIKKIEGKPCKIIYNGAGAFEFLHESFKIS